MLRKGRRKRNDRIHASQTPIPRIPPVEHMNRSQPSSCTAPVRLLEPLSDLALTLINCTAAGRQTVTGVGMAIRIEFIDGKCDCVDQYIVCWLHLISSAIFCPSIDCSTPACRARAVSWLQRAICLVSWNAHISHSTSVMFQISSRFMPGRHRSISQFPCSKISSVSDLSFTVFVF
jgi:hypothetical protein